MPPPAFPAPLDPPIAPITGDTLAWTLPVLDAFAGELDVTVGREPMAEGRDGYYHPGKRRIALNPAIAVNQQAAALAHELAHGLVRLDHHDDDPQLDYATEELVAECVIFSPCQGQTAEQVCT